MKRAERAVPPHLSFLRPRSLPGLSGIVPRLSHSCSFSTLVPLGVLWGSNAAGQAILHTLWATNGTVYATALSSTGDTLYLGGNFTYVGPTTGSWLGINGMTGPLRTPFAKANGTIFAAAPDGAGSWYIGGDFTLVGGASRSSLAHINSNGAVTNWNPNPDNSVYALAVSGTTVYVGGDFTNIGGKARSKIAALDVITANAKVWEPRASNIVNSLVVSGSIVYADGELTTIGGQVRHRIAALDAVSGGATAWNPNALFLSSGGGPRPPGPPHGEAGV